MSKKTSKLFYKFKKLGIDNALILCVDGTEGSGIVHGELSTLRCYISELMNNNTSVRDLLICSVCDYINSCEKDNASSIDNCTMKELIEIQQKAIENEDYEKAGEIQKQLVKLTNEGKNSK